MSLSKERWEYLKALKPAAPRYIHVSKDAKMIPHPTIPEQWVPWVAPHGTTYNVGRNKAKREARLGQV